MQEAGGTLALRKLSGAHEEAVGFAGGAAAFVDGPDDEGLAAAAVAGGEDVGDVGFEFSVFGLVVGAGVEFDAELGGDGVLGPKETHGEEAEVAGPFLLGTWELLHFEL